MKKILSLFMLFLLSRSGISQNSIAFFNDGIVFIKNYKLEIKDTIMDGKTFKYPANWNIRKGLDGEIVTYPDGWIISEGKDGHLVAFPKGWMVIKSQDGRIVPLLHKEKIVNFKEKKKDCVVTESDDCMINVIKSTNEYGLYTRMGSDGRVIAYTKEMNIASGPDGRLVNLPNGWEVVQSSKGRFSAYPKNWDAFVLDDNKEVAMPKNWNIDPQTNSPKIVQGKDFMKFIYTPVQQIKLAEAIYSGDNKNGLDYILYMLFNQE